MTQRLSEAVQRAASRAVTQESAAWCTASVAAVYEDGTVDIATSLGPVERVRRLRAYGSPQVGDVVKVSRSPDGNWLVEDATATSSSGWQPVTPTGGWSVSGASSDAPPAVIRTVDGLTMLSGVIAGGTITTTADAIVATVPTSCRPTYKGICLIVGSVSVVRAILNSDGAVTARLISGSSPAWISLDGIQGR